MDVSTVWDFCGEIMGTVRPRRGYVPATVTRIDADGTVWVTTGDGMEAPASSCSASVDVGDVVSVSWSGAQMGVTSNATDPSAGTRAVRTVQAAARSAAKVAGKAQAIADAIGQHFFADSNGVHVSTEEGNPTGERNILMNSLGILLRQGSAWLASFTDSAVAFYDGLGNSAANSVAQFGSDGARIGYLSSLNSIVEAGLFAIRNATDRLFSVETDGNAVGIYMGGSIAPIGVNYTDAFVEAVLRFLQDGCTVSGGKVYASNGTDTGYTVNSQGFVKDGNGRSFSSASYSDIGYLNGAFYLEPQLSPQQETQAVPVSIDMGNANVSANDGRLTVTGATTVKGSVSANNLCEVNATRSLGTGGTARAYRVGSLLVVTGTFTGCTVGTAGTWVDLCTVYAPAINVTGTVTKLGCIADVSGGGAGFDGDINAGLHIASGTLQVLVQLTTNKAFSDRTVRFIAMAQVS